MIVAGTLTAYKNYSIGKEQVDAKQANQRYVVPADKNWYHN